MKKKSYVVSKKFVINTKEEFSTDDDDDGIASNRSYHKIRDRYHYTGKYRGDAHDIFNITYKTPK